MYETFIIRRLYKRIDKQFNILKVKTLQFELFKKERKSNENFLTLLVKEKGISKMIMDFNQPKTSINIDIFIKKLKEDLINRGSIPITIMTLDYCRDSLREYMIWKISLMA